MAKSLKSLLMFRNTKQLLFTLLRVSLTIFALLFSPILFIIYGVLLLYRILVSKLAHHFDPKLGKMVSSLSSIFAAHDIYGNSYTNNIGLHVVGKIDRMHLIRGFENLLKTSLTPDGEPMYPELCQNIVTKFGFKFWRNLDNFQVDTHVTYLNPEKPDEQLTLQDMRNTIAKFGKTPLNPSQSPWHVFIVKKFKSCENPKVKSAIILRLHHAMFDGNSVLNVFNKMADNDLVLAGPNLNQIMANELPKKGTFSWWFQALLKPFVVFMRGPYELIGQLLSYDNNELIKMNRRDFKGVMRFHECEPILLDDLKEIKNFYKVSMTTLNTTLAVRGLKKFLEKRKINVKKVHMTFPLPVLNHPDKLRNYFSGGIISFDMTHDDRIKLLQAVQQKYYQFRFAFATGLPEVSMLLLRILGSLPIFLTPRIDNVPLSSTIMHSSFPGPVDLGYFCGFPIVDATVGGSISKPYPTGILSYSYNGIYKFGVTGDACIFTTQEEIKEFGDYIYQEFLEFSRITKENNV